ncbi:MAG: tetratricopeptide repeat protein [Clostridia bacterium]|nr:tetratricopeptide repeat protein [Clostridia bacterium]
MKLTIIRVICVLLILAAVGLYVYGIVVNGDGPTDNLLRSVIIALSGVSALMKTFPKRRPLTTYANAFAKELGSAFAEDPKKRERLLEAVRLFDEDKNSAALKLLEELKLDARTRDEIYAVGLFTALCQKDLGLSAAAIATYEDTAAKGAESSQLYSNLGILYGETDPDKAFSAYMKAIKLDPQNAMPHNNVAALLLRLGEYDGAGQAAANALEINPNQHQAWTTLAVVSAIQGDAERSEKCIRKAVECGQEEAALRRAITHYMNIAEQDAAEEA